MLPLFEHNSGCHRHRSMSFSGQLRAVVCIEFYTPKHLWVNEPAIRNPDLPDIQIEVPAEIWKVANKIDYLKRSNQFSVNTYGPWTI